MRPALFRGRVRRPALASGDRDGGFPEEWRRYWLADAQSCVIHTSLGLTPQIRGSIRRRTADKRVSIMPDRSVPDDNGSSNSMPMLIQ